MKTILLFLLLFGCSIAFAQQSLTVGVQVDERSTPLTNELRDLLYNRVQRGLARHGVGADGGATLSVLATMDAGVLSMTNTAPPRYVRTYFVELQLTNTSGGEVFAAYSEEITVAKRAEEAAKRAAITSLALRGERFQEFMTRAKQEIGDYYRENCAVVLGRARQQLAGGDFINGMQTLSSIPPAADCSAEATEILANTFPEYERIACDRQVAYAEALVAAEQFEQAQYQLLTIPDPSRCQERFSAVVEQIQRTRQNLREDAMTRLLLVSKIEADQTERRRRFLENMAFVQSQPCCRGINEQGRIIIID